jgi:hypothetical protein
MHLFREEDQRYVRSFQVDLDIPIQLKPSVLKDGHNTRVQVSNTYAMSGVSKQDIV